MANRIKVEPQVLEQAGGDMAVAASTTREAVSNVVSWSRPVTGSSGLTPEFTGSMTAAGALYSFWYSLQEQLTLAAEVFAELGSRQGATPGKIPDAGPAPAHPSTQASYMAPRQLLASIPGDHVALTQLGRRYSVAASTFQEAWNEANSIKENLFRAWDSASPSHEHAFEVALSRSQYASQALDTAAHALYRYAGELAVAQDAHTRAMTQIATLQTDLAADPENKPLETQLRHHVGTAFNAQDKAVQAANTFAATMTGCTSKQWYQIPPLTARFDAVTAAMLDSLVAHRWMSSQDAYLAAQRLETLSQTDHQALVNAEATATTDAQRGSLYKALAGGQPVSAFTLPPPALTHGAPDRL